MAGLGLTIVPVVPWEGLTFEHSALTYT